MSISAARLAREHFGIDGTADPLPGERTLNFEINGASGRFVLKLHPLTERDDVDLENAALLHVAANGATAQVPKPLPIVHLPQLTVEVDFDGASRIARLLRWLPGDTWESVGAPAPDALAALGHLVAQVDAALASFQHPHLDRPLRWNLARAHEVRDLLDSVSDPDRRAAATQILEDFATRVRPALEEMPSQAIHGDANDRNVLVDEQGQVTGLIDFGDLCRAPRVCGIAIAAAYAMFDHADPVRAVVPLVAGYHAEAPLREDELAVLFPLIRARLAVSVVMAGWQHSLDPTNDYLLSSQNDVWSLLQRLAFENSDLAHFRFRAACGYEPNPSAPAVRDHLGHATLTPVLGRPMADLTRLVLDWSVENDDRPESSAAVVAAMAEAGADVGIGRYCEDRNVYRTAAFAPTSPLAVRRTIHLGVDLFAPAGNPVFSPLPGRVHDFADNAQPLDYGPVIVLEHQTADGVRFWTLYGHLGRESLQGLKIGNSIAAGQRIAVIGREAENGGWPPHVHVQLLTHLVGMGLDVYGVAPADELPLWRSISPDPGLVIDGATLSERSESES